MKTIFFIGTLALISAFALIISWVSSANLSIWSLIGFVLSSSLFIYWPVDIHEKTFV